MSLHFGAQREDTIAHGDFSNWIVKNVHDCIKIAEDYGSGIERMEDIILVTGRHLAKSWIYATFPESPEDITITVQVRVPKTSAIHLREWNVNGGHLKLGPSGEDLPENQCVFVRGYRVVCAQDSTSGLQGMDLQAVTVGGPSDPETIQTAPLSESPRSVTGQATAQQQNYLRIRRKQKQIGVLAQDRDSLKTEDDVSWLDNEECEDDFVENGNDNGPSSPDTMSKRSFSTQSTIGTVSSKPSKMLS